MPEDPGHLIALVEEGRGRRPRVAGARVLRAGVADTGVVSTGVEEPRIGHPGVAHPDLGTMLVGDAGVAGAQILNSRRQGDGRDGAAVAETGHTAAVVEED